MTISTNDAGQRLDKFLSKALPSLPPALLYKYIRKKRIKCNGKRCEISTRLVEGDLLELYIGDEFFIPPEDVLSFLRAGKLTGVLYEDANILAVDKPPGLVVHEDDDGTTDTLIARILRYLYERGEYSPESELSFVPSLCNRIDRNTGGIVLAAKNAEALRILNEKIRNHELQKLYVCAVQGIPSPSEATLTAFLVKDTHAKQVRISDKKLSGARTIVTKYRVLHAGRAQSLLEVELITGRTHQIRAHFAHIGHPLLGDGKYGDNRINRETGYPRQALYARKLTFRFITDAGALAYLDGMQIEAKDIWFLERYYAYNTL